MIVPDAHEERTERLRRALRRWRGVARAVLLFERVWPALWPSLGLLGLFVCAALLNLPQLLPGWLHLLLLIAIGLAAIGLAAWRLRSLHLPRAAAADRRLERDSGLRHRPLTVLTDRAATAGDPGLWQAHLARAAAEIGRLRVGLPHPGLAARDPRALRAGLVVLLVACLVIAGADAPSRIARALTPGFAPGASAASTQLQAWITPPGYTGQAPLFLRADTPAIAVPAGSHLTVNVTGAVAAPSMTLVGRAVPFKPLDDASFQAERELSDGGRLVVSGGNTRLGAWDITVIADQAPVVSFPQPPGSTAGRIPQLRLPWQVSHAYGVVGLHAELRLRDRPDAAPLEITIPLPGGAPKAAHGVRQLDLTPNPWAGLPVIARLVGRDAAGLVGHSADAGFTLPERQFSHPVARALMAVRKMLTLKPDERDAAIAALDSLAGLDDVWRDTLGGFVNLRAIAGLLRRDPSPPAVEEAQGRMWQLALQLEEGAAARTARALEQARQALRDALDAEKRGDKLDKAELERLTQALQQALDRHLQALADQARRNPDTDQFDPRAHPLDARDMQRLAEQLRRDAEQGKTEDARDKLAQLEKMLDAMKNARPEHGRMTQAERERAQQRQRGQQQLSALQDVIQRQGALLDNADARSHDALPPEARPPMPNSFTWPPPAPALAPPPNPAQDQANADKARAQDRQVQLALRRVLGEVMQQYGDLTGKVPPNLGDADTAMREAAQSLAAGHDPAAAGAQLRAIEALQKGGQAMGSQMARQFGTGQPGEGQSGDGQPGSGQNGEGQNGEGEGQDGPGFGQGQRGYGPGGRGWANTGRGNPWDQGPGDRPGGRLLDPLGRPLQEGANGRNDGGDVKVPDQMERARTRAIQEELRRREAERSRPQPELEYFDRLLRQY
jgi:uncharacterized protein (TIGR02302 family)